MSENYRRTPKNYDGTHLTTHRIGELLPIVLEKIGESYKDRPDLILAAWPEIVGPQIAAMTKAVSFTEGVLLVKVKNSSLHSLFIQRDKPKVLESLRHKFPKVDIKNVVFRIG